MIEKTFAELTTKEKFRLQRIVKSKRRGQTLSGEEQQLYDKFIDEYQQIEKSTKSKWPIIAGLIAISLIVLVRKCDFI